MSNDKIDRGFTSLVINIWVDESIQHALDTCSRRRPILEKITNCLEEGGFIRSQEKKIKTLKQKSKKIKDNNNLSRRNRKKLKHFDKMDEITGCRPITRLTN